MYVHIIVCKMYIDTTLDSLNIDDESERKIDIDINYYRCTYIHMIDSNVIVSR